MIKNTTEVKREIYKMIESEGLDLKKASNDRTVRILPNGERMIICGCQESNNLSISGFYGFTVRVKYKMLRELSYVAIGLKFDDDTYKVIVLDYVAIRQILMVRNNVAQNVSINISVNHDKTAFEIVNTDVIRYDRIHGINLISKAVLSEMRRRQNPFIRRYRELSLQDSRIQAILEV